MFFGVGLYNLFNLFFHLFMIRNLNPIDYGNLNTLMSFLMIISVPSNTIQTTITKFVSIFYANYRITRIRIFLKNFLFIIGSFALFILLIIIIFSNSFSSFFQIPSREIFFLVGLIIFFSMLIPIPLGGLQGLQRFVQLAINLILNGGLKLILGVVFILIGYGLIGAFVAIAFSYIITLFLSIILIEFFLKGKVKLDFSTSNLEKNNYFSVSEIFRYFLPTGIAFFCFMILTQIDMILIKHFFSPIEAGYYSIAQMVGKIILFIPLPIIMIMFPKVSFLETRKIKSISILIQSLILGGFLCGLGIFTTYFFPELFLKILTGKIYSECIPLMKIFSINMTFYSLNYIIINYHLALSRKKFLLPLVIMTILQVIIIILIHETMIKILQTIMLISFCLFIINIYLIVKKERPYYCFLDFF